MDSAKPQSMLRKALLGLSACVLALAAALCVCTTQAHAATEISAGNTYTYTVKNHNSVDVSYTAPKSGYFRVYVSASDSTLGSSWKPSVRLSSGSAIYESEYVSYTSQWKSDKYCLKAGKKMTIRLSAFDAAGASLDNESVTLKVKVVTCSSKAAKYCEKEGKTNKVSKLKTAYEGTLHGLDSDTWKYTAKKKGTYKIYVTNCTDSNNSCYSTLKWGKKSVKNKVLDKGQGWQNASKQLVNSKAKTVTLKKGKSVSVTLKGSAGYNSFFGGSGYSHYKVKVVKVK